MFLLKLGFRPWRRSFFSQIFAAFAGGVILFLAATMIWGQFAIQPVISKIRNEQVLTAYLDPSVDKKQEDKLVDTVRETLGSQRVQDLKFVDSKTFLEDLKDQFKNIAPGLSEELMGLGNELEMVVPRYISVSGRFEPDTQDKLKAIVGIQTVDSSYSRSLPVVGAFSGLRWGMLIFAFGLILASLIGWIHLSRSNAHFLRDLGPFLRLWGAGAWAARVPQLISGGTVGFVSGGVAFTAWMFATIEAVGLLKKISPVLSAMKEPPVTWGLALWGVAILLGLVAGLASSSPTRTNEGESWL